MRQQPALARPTSTTTGTRSTAALFSRDPDVAFRINAFDWSSRDARFRPGLRRAVGGFDCIIGNPPYIRVQELNHWAPEECEFYKWRYKSAAKGNYDIYVVFIERALELLADDGLLGFICPHKFWQATYGEGIRKIIAEGRHLRSVIDFTDQQVFRGATTYTAIHVLSKKRKPRSRRLRRNRRTDGRRRAMPVAGQRTQSRHASSSYRAERPRGRMRGYSSTDDKPVG